MSLFVNKCFVKFVHRTLKTQCNMTELNQPHRLQNCAYHADGLWWLFRKQIVVQIEKSLCAFL